MHYLAYGSNLHPLRLALRVPNCRLVGTVQLEGCRLAFRKRGSDGSSKCNLDLTGNPADVAHAAIYELPEDEVHHLDLAEGLGAGYYKEHMTITLDGRPLPVFVYLASPSHLLASPEPYHWYKAIVLAGARMHRFPAEYVRQIAAVASKADPDDARRLEMEELLARLGDYP